MPDFQLAKEAAGKKAAELVQPGMQIGLGTGSTVAYFLAALSQRIKRGLQIKAVASSERSAQQAREGGIPLLDANTVTTLDMNVDGADEIDVRGRMIKGGGGALLREKIIASMSRKNVIIIDASKRVDFLGKFPLPVEIVPFGCEATLGHLTQLGYHGKLRQTSEGYPYVTDGGHWIYDIALPYPCQSPEKEHVRIRAIPGVIETGFFFHLAHCVIVGHNDGKIQIIGDEKHTSS